VGQDFAPSIPVAPTQTARGFFVAFLITVFVLSIPASMSLLFFLRSGENWTYRSLVSFQRSHNAIFAPAAEFDRFEYKLEMIRQIRPEVVVLGSSRALGFQGRYFRVPFVNAGHAMRSLEEGELFLSEMDNVPKPKNIIIVVDFWWFNPSSPPAGQSYGRFPRLALNRDLALLPLEYIWKGELALWQLPAVALLGYRRNAITNFEDLGIEGIATSNGMRPDGSMLYAWVLGDRSNYDPFARPSSMIAAGSDNFARAENVDRRLFDRFANIVKGFQSKEIAVSLVVPPVAPKIRDMLARNGGYGYIGKFRTMLRELVVPTVDFHDPEQIPATDCHFMDAYHTGDVTYLKMLVEMARRWTWLAGLVDVTGANRTIAAFDGNFIDQSNSEFFTGLTETNFLGMSCPRQKSPRGPR
jgi:hypothetical protein